jgi:hypothetical protein
VSGAGWIRRLVRLSAVALALGGGGAAGEASAATTLPTGPLRISVDRAPLTPPLPEGFVGVALETSTIPQWVGSATTAAQVNPVLVQLLRNLNPVGSPSIRIGGQSTDRSWWPVPNLSVPVGVTYALGTSWARAAALLAQRLDAQYVMSVNLEADSPRISQYEADELLRAIGPRYIKDFEIGNEPDLYTHTPWYRVKQGKQVPWYIRVGTPYFARPAGFNEADFLAEWKETLPFMPAGVPIAGPDTANAQWIRPFSTLLGQTRRIGMLDSHAYALFNCVSDPANPKYPSIPHLLELSAATRIVQGAGEFLPLARHAGIPFRIDEMGSVSCDGHAGVSNAFASALWVTDALFEAARAGVSGVNLHSFPNSDNGLFDLLDTPTGWIGDVHPIYYGALMFAQADPEGARILEIPSPAPSTLRIWATIGADHRVRVLIINVGSHQLVTIHAPKGFGTRDASVERLLAPSVSAVSGETIGGQTLQNTATGAVAAPTLQWARPRSTGYTVAAPAGSETLLTLSYRTKAPPAGGSHTTTTTKAGGASPARSSVLAGTGHRRSGRARSSAR